MNIERLKTVFALVAREAELDFAIPDASTLGMNAGQVADAITQKFGANASGIWARYWSTEEVSNARGDELIAIEHQNLDRNQVELMYDTFEGMGYWVSPKKDVMHNGVYFTFEVPEANMKPRKFFVETPLGLLRVSAKHKGLDDPEDYPGVYVDLIHPGTGKAIPLTTVEYDQLGGGKDGGLYTDVYADALSDEVTDRIYHEHVEHPDLDLAKQLINDYCIEELREDANFSDMGNIGIGYASVPDTDEAFSVQVCADLNDFCCKTYMQRTDLEPWVLVRCDEFKTLEDMVENFLEQLDFDTLTALEENDWCNYFQHSRPGVEWLREKFPEGARIELEDMRDPYAPVPAGTLGTVDHVDDAGNIHMLWDNGRTLALAYGVDLFHTVQTGEGVA